MAVDDDEKKENMCPKCRDEVASKHCIRCGKQIDSDDEEQFTNPNFDYEKFKEMSGGK